MLQNRPRSTRRIEVWAAEGAGEVVQLLKSPEPLGQLQIRPVGEDDQRADDGQWQHGPGVPPCGVEHHERQTDAGTEDQGEPEEVKTAGRRRPLTVEADDNGD